MCRPKGRWDTEVLKEPEQGIEEWPPKPGAAVDQWLESLQMSDIPLANDKNLALCEMARWLLNSSFCQAWTFACFFPTLPHHFIGTQPLVSELYKVYLFKAKIKKKKKNPTNKTPHAYRNI